MKTMKGSRFCLPLLYRSIGTLGDGEFIRMRKFRLQGYERVVGNFHATTAAAAGFPRIRQSADGTNWSLVYAISQDATQSDFQYPFDVKIRLPYISVEYQQGAVDSGNFLCWAEARPE